QNSPNESPIAQASGRPEMGCKAVAAIITVFSTVTTNWVVTATTDGLPERCPSSMNVARHSHTPNIAAVASTWTNLIAKMTSSIAGPAQQIGALPQDPPTGRAPAAYQNRCLAPSTPGFRPPGPRKGPRGRRPQLFGLDPASRNRFRPLRHRRLPAIQRDQAKSARRENPAARLPSNSDPGRIGLATCASARRLQCKPLSLFSDTVRRSDTGSH